MGLPMVSIAIFDASTVKTFWEGLALSFSRTSFGSLPVLMTKTASSFAPSATLIASRSVASTTATTPGFSTGQCIRSVFLADAVVRAERRARALGAVFRECLHLAAAGETRVGEHLGRGDGPLTAPAVPPDLDHFCHETSSYRSLKSEIA